MQMGAHSNIHVANINSSLKNIKSEVTVEFIRPDVMKFLQTSSWKNKVYQ